VRISDRLKHAVLGLLIVLAGTSAARAQSYPESRFLYPPPGPGIRDPLSTVFVGAITAGILVDSYYAWWRDAEEPFHFYSSSWFSENSGIDRAGHFFTSYFFYHTFRDIQLWGGSDPTTARWWAAGLAAFEALSIEIGDGMSPYGFDPKDFLFNLGGIGYGILQEEVPYLQNFTFKFSYWSTYGLKSPANFTADYDAMTIWLALNVHNLLPEEAQEWWPAWLGVAVGYSVDDQATRSEVLFSIDINLEAIDLRSPDAALAQSVLNKLHLPAPGVKFTEGKPPTWSMFLLR
jgi:hypothetical protein